jgi:V8-like Glu-specific endopeptidase
MPGLRIRLFVLAVFLFIVTDKVRGQVVSSEGAQTSPLRKYTAREILDELRLREAFQSKDKGFTTLGAKAGKFAAVVTKNTYVASAASELRALKTKSGLRELSSTELIREINSRVKPKGIYGSIGADNRTDLDVLDSRLAHLVDSGVPADHPKRRAIESILKNCQSVGCMVKASTDLFTKPEGKLGLVTERYGPFFGLCTSERFYDQPAAPFCTVFLVKKNIVVTAGHCLRSQGLCTEGDADISQFRVLFGFRKLADGTVKTEFAAGDLYSVAEVISHKCTASEDWAILRLDRDVTGVSPLTIRQSGQIPNKEDVYVVGHPQGLPLKFADGAFVRSNQDPLFFTSNLDTYRGNSGSPVFSLNTHEIEGILVRGGQDFELVFNGDTQCYQSVVVPDEGGQGESVTRSTVFVSLIPQ